MSDDRWVVDMTETRLGELPAMQHIINGAARANKYAYAPAILYAKEAADVAEFITELVKEIERLQNENIRLREHSDLFIDLVTGRTSFDFEAS